MKFPYTDAQLARIRRASAEKAAHQPYAESVRYDATTGRLEIALRGDITFSLPARRLRGLNTASEQQLAQVRVVDGRALFWDGLDVQMTLLAMLADGLGLVTSREVARRAGSARTPVKAAAARANGAKGGRPRKAVKTVAAAAD